MIDHFLRDASGVLSCPFWSTVLQCCARLPEYLKLLDRAVSGTRFLTGGVFEFDIAHRRSVTDLCMLYKIWCNPMQALKDALTGTYVPVIGILMPASLQNLAVP